MEETPWRDWKARNCSSHPAHSASSSDLFGIVFFCGPEFKGWVGRCQPNLLGDEKIMAWITWQVFFFWLVSGRLYKVCLGLQLRPGLSKDTKKHYPCISPKSPFGGGGSLLLQSEPSGLALIFFTAGWRFFPRVNELSCPGENWWFRCLSFEIVGNGWFRCFADWKISLFGEHSLVFGDVYDTKWWQLKYFLFSPQNLGKIPIWTIIFQMGGSTTN